MVDPFLIEEEAWKSADIIVSGSKSDFISNTLLIHIPNNSATDYKICAKDNQEKK